MSQQPLSFSRSPTSHVVQLRQNLVWLSMVVVALPSAPGSHSGWAIFWVIVSALLGGFFLTAMSAARLNGNPNAILTLFTIGIVAAAAGIIISISVRPLSGIFLLILLVILAFTGKERPFVTTAIIIITAPWWVWLMLNAWRWQLLVLLPLIGLGLLATSHLLDTHVWPPDEERLLSPRAHRLAAWLLVAASGILLIVAGLLTDMSRPWLALAGIVLALSIPLEAGFGSSKRNSAQQSIRIVASTYLIAAACWLVGIP